MAAGPAKAVGAGSSDPDAGPEDFDGITRFLLAHWLLIAIVAVAGAGAGLVVARIQSKVYRAEVLVTPVAQDAGSPLHSLIGQYGGLASLAGIDLPKGGGSTSATVAVLKSRSFIEKFIADRNLLPVLFWKSWDASAKRWVLKSDQQPPSLQDGYGLFMKSVMHVEEDKDKDLITISVEWRDPQLAATWANDLVQRLNEAARARAITDAERSIEYLGKELEHTQTVEIRESIYALLQMQINNRMLANTRPDFAFSVLDPAQAPQRNRYVRPIPLMLAAIGFFAGAAVALLAALLAPRIARSRRRLVQ
jgi:uncharacterized protein involved in exopolysaccharide biosynthesis